VINEFDGPASEAKAVILKGFKSETVSADAAGKIMIPDGATSVSITVFSKSHLTVMPLVLKGSIKVYLPKSIRAVGKSDGVQVRIRDGNGPSPKIAVSKEYDSVKNPPKVLTDEKGVALVTDIKGIVYLGLGGAEWSLMIAPVDVGGGFDFQMPELQKK
jgi:hypothetical protein